MISPIDMVFTCTCPPIRFARWMGAPVKCTMMKRAPVSEEISAIIRWSSVPMPEVETVISSGAASARFTRSRMSRIGPSARTTMPVGSVMMLPMKLKLSRLYWARRSTGTVTKEGMLVSPITCPSGRARET